MKKGCLNNLLRNPHGGFDEYVSLGYDSAIVITPITQKIWINLKKKCIVSKGEYCLKHYIWLKFYTNPCRIKITLHLASILFGQNIRLITYKEAIEAIDNASSIIGIDLTTARLIGVTITGNMWMDQPVCDYLSLTVSRYGRKKDNTFSETVYINDRKGTKGDIQRVFYNKILESGLKDIEGNLLRFELRINRNLHRHLKFGKDFIILQLSDLGSEMFFRYCVRKWWKELASCLINTGLPKKFYESSTS